MSGLYLTVFQKFMWLKVQHALPKFPVDDIARGFPRIEITCDQIVDDILNDRVQGYIEKYVPLIWKNLYSLTCIDKRMNFSTYISHTGIGDCDQGLLFDYFLSNKKPAFVIQHGAYGFALNRHTEYSDFGHNGVFLSWGNGVKEMYENRKKGECKIVPTGSHLIQKIRKNRKLKKNIRKVCYIPGSYRGYTAYYPNGQPCLDSKLFVLETILLITLKPYLDKYEITYKPAPGSNSANKIEGRTPMIEWVKDNLPGMRIESRPLLQLIHDFDFFIIDWPTTTIIQAMASGAEVLIYAGNPYYKIRHEDLTLFKKRAVVVFNTEDYKKNIESILDTGKILSNIDDAAFLEKYGIFIDDGNALQRMEDEVIKRCRYS